MLINPIAPYCSLLESSSWTSQKSRTTSSKPGLIHSPENGQQAKLLEMEQQVQLYHLLTQINKEIISTLDLEKVLNSACYLVGQVLQCSRVSILVNEAEEGSEFVTGGEYKSEESLINLSREFPLENNSEFQEIITTRGEILEIKQFQSFSGLGRTVKTLAKKLRIHSVLAMATRYQGQVNGIIGVYQFGKKRDWTAWEKQLLEGVASQLAIAIHNAQLYKESRRKAEQESLLRLVTNQIRSTLDLHTILKTAVQGVRQVLNTDRVVIYQFTDGWQGEIQVEDLVVPWPSILGNQIQDQCFPEKYGKLYLEGRVRAIHDIHQAGLDPCHVNFLESLQVRANLVVPILMGWETQPSSQASLKSSDSTSPPSPFMQNKLWGLLIAHECRHPRHWKTWETEGLQQLANQMAIAINQAELYAQVQNAAIRYQAQAQQLQTTLDELRSTQLQLIQSEKLSSLGQMVAGIAHEINNPNNFIYANISHAQDYAKNLLEALEQCQVVCPEVADTLHEIQEELEIDYIREDFPKLLKSMREGSERIRGIVSTLQDFSHLDKAEVKWVDITEGIENSLAILKNRLPAQIKINKKYNKTPQILCRAGQINQVFFNLLNNAVDALESQDQPELTIKTELTQPNWITISIQDNGIGIAEDIQKRIFDPFFTTKPVGQGIGMGLAICHQVIVKSHGGKIDCLSQPQKGTELIVELPVRLMVNS